MKIKNLHRWDITAKEAIEIQLRLPRWINLNDLPEKINLIAGADAAFSKKAVIGAVSIFSFPDLKLIETKTAAHPLRFPYIPGLLTFREGPALLKCFRKLKNTPDVILFDGQGISHPRRMGIATHLGILLDTPSIGCAKSHLYGEFKLPENTKGSSEYAREKGGEIIGASLRTRTGVKPVFVSVGNKINLSKSIEIVLACVTKYRIPEPLRHTHRLAEMTKKAL